MHRREFVTAAAITGASLAGCVGTDAGPEDGVSQELPIPYQGGDGVPVVRAFTDYGCHHCARYTLQEYPKIYKKLVVPGKVEYRHYDFPLPVSEWSFKVAYASRWIQANHGVESYWLFHPAIYAAFGDYSIDVIVATAERATGEDVGDEIRSAIEDEAYRGTILKEKEIGEDRYDVGGTPYVFVDGTRVKATADGVISALETA